MREKPHRDLVDELEAALFESLTETLLAVGRLELVCRTNHTLTLMLTEERSRERAKLILENTPRRRKAPRSDDARRIRK